VKGAWDRPVERAARLLTGLVLFGLGLAALVEDDLGLDPWTVFSEGVARHTGLTIGQVTVISSFVVLAAWVPLTQRPGLGTVANALIVGFVLDLGVAVLPTPEALAGRLAYVAAAIAGVAVGSGLYVGAGWGPGPRDGLMTGLADRGVPLALARAGVEVTVLVAGWLLGGTVGLATVVFAITIGPLVKLALQTLGISPRRPRAACAGRGRPRPARARCPTSPTGRTRT
jgi:uncharacterized membrane protein YczE